MKLNPLPRISVWFAAAALFQAALVAQTPPAAAPAQPPMPVMPTEPVASNSARSAQVLHTQLCALCHGANWEGARAPSMLDDVWAHGGTDEDLARSIRDGWP